MKILKFLFILIIFAFVAILFIALLFMLTATIWRAGEKFVNHPSVDMLPTAQYLYTNPMSAPNSIQISSVSDENDKICVSFLDNEGFIHWTRWFLNGALIPSTFLDFTVAQEIYPPSRLIYCLTPDGINALLAGIHLFELQLRTSPFDAGVTYQWAIKVDASTPIPASP